jgi:hypothetical protein
MMTAETVSRTIQFIIAPAVMISACAIILGGVLSRYAAINDRLRALAKERMDMVRVMHAQTVDMLTKERLSQIDVQLPDLLRRHKLIHDAVFVLYCAMLTYILTMLVIALAAQLDSAWIATMALGIFLVGTTVLAGSIFLTILEVRISQRAVSFEVRQILDLKM